MPAKQIGVVAADAVVQLSEHLPVDTVPMRKLLPHRWLECASTAPVVAR